MVLLCLTWGLQQVVLKLAAPDIAPLMQIGLRSGLAALLVGAVLTWQRTPGLSDPALLRPGLLAGALFAFEFFAVGEGLRHTSASHMVVFLYTAPIFVALALHRRLPAERLHAGQWAGIALAFAGIAIAFAGRGAAAAGSVLWGDFLALLAGLAWGATTVVIRCSALARAPATLTLFYQLAAACVLLVGAALALGQATIRWTPTAFASLAFHGIVVSFASFLAWFALLRRYPAAQLGVFSFLTPLLGVGFGVWLLGDPLDTTFVLGAVLVLAGILLVNAGALRALAVRRWRRPAAV